MVEHHVLQGLDAGGGQGLDGGANFGPAARREARVGGHEGHGVVAPVVGQAELLQVSLVDPGRGRQQFDGGDPQALQVVDGGGVGETREGPANRLGNIRVGAGEAAHVQLIDHRLAPRDGEPRRRGRGGRGDHPLRHGRGAVGLVERGAAFGIVVPIAEHRGVQDEGPVEGQGVGVDQQLVGIEPMALRRGERAIGAQAVARAFRQSGDVAVEHRTGAAGQADAPGLDLAGGVKQAELYSVGVGGVDGDIESAGGQADAEGLRRAIRHAAGGIGGRHLRPRVRRGGRDRARRRAGPARAKRRRSPCRWSATGARRRGPARARPSGGWRSQASGC